MPDQPGEQSRRLAALDALQKESRGVRAEPSALRLYIRDNYASLIAARNRGVSWQQIADVMAGAGVLAPDGSALTWRKVAVLFHTERYGKGHKRKRGAGRKPVAAPAAAQAEVPSLPPPRPPEPPLEQPKAAGGPFATGDAALDRALNSVRTLKPLPPMGNMDTQGRRSPKPTRKQDDGEDG